MLLFMIGRFCIHIFSPKVTVYSEPYGMGHLSNTELNLTCFYRNPDFLLALWKDFAELNQKQLKVLKNVIFGSVVWERNIWPLRNQYIFT